LFDGGKPLKMLLRMQAEVELKSNIHDTKARPKHIRGREDRR